MYSSGSKAAKSFSLQLDEVGFSNGIFPVLSNSEPIATIDGNILKERLKKQRVKELKYELSNECSKEIDDIFQQQEGGIVNLEFITHRNVLELQWRNKDQLHGVIRPLTGKEMADSVVNKSNLISADL